MTPAEHTRPEIADFLDELSVQAEGHRLFREKDVARLLAALADRDARIRDELERIERWALDQNSGNAFATQLAHSVRVTLDEWNLPPKDREP